MILQDEKYLLCKLFNAKVDGFAILLLISFDCWSLPHKPKTTESLPSYTFLHTFSSKLQGEKKTIETNACKETKRFMRHK